MKYTITQSFSTENNTIQDESLTQSFTNKKEAKNYFDEIKNNTQQGGTIVTDFWLKDEVIETHYSDIDYTPHFGKLVIAYQHEGKGMGYSHKFLNAYWLDKNNCNLSENPDSRFKVWEDELREIEEIDELENEIDNGGWDYGVTLINEKDFEEYCEGLVEDVGDLPSDMPAYIRSNIDWQGVADDLRQDYSEVEFRGVTYLYR